MAVSATNFRHHNQVATRRLISQLQGYSAQTIGKAAKLAASTTRNRLQPMAKRAIREDYGVRAGALSGKFRVMTGADSVGEFVALGASTKRIPLIDFGGRWGGKARSSRGTWAQSATAAVQVGRRKVYQSAFIRTVGGSRQVLERQINRATGKRDPRSRLRRLMGPSPFVMIEGPNGTAEKLRNEAIEFHAGEFRRQLIRLGVGQ